MIQGPLNGLRVIDCSRILAGPYCTMLLGDMGAEVIKIEQPGSGDGSRQWGPPWFKGESAYFLSVNRNKKSLTVNLKHPDGAAIVKRLVEDADVLVENFLPGTMDRFGLGYSSLSELNPRLVYCSITGYGQNGPYKDNPGFDFMIQAQGGIMSITGPVEGPPFKLGVAIVDITAGLFASNAILAALYHREQSRKGQYIDVALLDSQIASLINVAHNYFASDEPPKRYGNAHANIVPYEVFETEDGYLALAVGTDAQYRRLCEACGKPELWDDERYQTNAGRVKNRAEFIPLWQSVFKEQRNSTWIELLEVHHIPVGPINDIPTLFTDPQVAAREMIQTVKHPTLGPVQQLGPVARLSETPSTLRLAPPLLGEHTEEILREKLAYSQAAIEKLKADGVI